MSRGLHSLRDSTRVSGPDLERHELRGESALGFPIGNPVRIS